MTGGPVRALWGFLVFYAICIALTWFYYTRPGGLLHERRTGKALPRAASPATEY